MWVQEDVRRAIITLHVCLDPTCPHVWIHVHTKASQKVSLGYEEREDQFST